ncbi:trans-sulfuration enzyme family protein [Arthrobacter castelli]|uniref:trans-sulfuration enzyme family protein n=1 Tax=Arthrobacter castelli TaxID=271431 RepID=UPI000412B54A|nr:PLP-dependent transferase [Arthrobacter castelli]
MDSSAPTAEEHTGLHQDSVAVASGRPDREPGSAVNPPVVLSSTYFGQGQVTAGDRSYGRYSNPTWDPFETALAELEGASEPALAYASGMAAAASALSLVPPGGTVVMPNHSYGGTVGLAQRLADDGAFSLRLVNIADTAEVKAQLAGGGQPAGGEQLAGGGQPADLLWVESPTNPMLEVADVSAIAAAAHDAGALVVADNTFSTPLVQQPLGLGADVVIHSVTKYLAGHSDVVLGAAVTSDPQLRERLLTHRSMHGSIAGPFETWMALRGLRTLALRVERSQANAAELASRLQRHPAVAAVRFPGLPDDPGHERAKRQMSGFGSIIGVEMAGGAAAADALVGRLKLWLPATSLGGVESLIERRRRHTNEPETVPEPLVRMSVGIEHVEDLWADLDQGMR